MYIDNKKLLHNLNYIKSNSNKKICAVVKANAYGHGLKQIVTLLSGKVDYFAVANLKEALKIRNVDKSTPTLILFNCDNYPLASKLNISVSVYSLEQAIKISKISFKTPLKVHIKINVGMNRLGFSSLNEVKKALKLLKNCTIEGLYTHYSTINSYPQLYKKQQKDFNKYVKFLKNIKKDIIIHTGGSYDILNKTSNMLRTGLFLYGYGNKNLKPIMSIYSPIIQVNKIRPNQYCGYDKEWKSSNKHFVGTIPIGYQDGIKKHFIGSEINLSGYKCKIVSVCMDCTMLELPCNLKTNKKIRIFNNANLYEKFEIPYITLTNFNGFRGVRKIKY